jgi:predicted TIM-barrel fold metal-dependent hydrolase
MSMPLITHTGGGESPLGVAPNLPGWKQLYAYERLWLTRRNLWQLIFGGVFERHPALRFILTEQVVSWVAETLADLDDLYRQFVRNPRYYSPPRMPSEYWATNCYNSGSFLAPHEAAMRHDVGLENLLWGSDYPHLEGTWPYTRLALRNTFAGLPEHDVRLILGENAIRAYNLDGARLRPIADRIGPRPEEVAVPLAPGEVPLATSFPGLAFREFENFPG